MQYQHSQFGTYSFISAILLGCFVASLLPIFEAPDWAYLVVILFFTPVVIFCSRLTIVIKKDELRWHFGAGMGKKSVSLQDITQCRVIELQPRDGFGVRQLKNGKQYNISGFSAVQLMLNDETEIRLGTDDAEALCVMIDQLRPQDQPHTNAQID